MRIISIANQKGGCGKTTTAINLAAALAANNRTTLLIDLDPQAHATLGLNIESNESIYNVISKLTPRKLKIENIIQRVEDSFDIVPSSILVGTLEQELAEEIGRELKLTEIVKTIKDNYEYIIIDCPPSLGFLTVNAVRASDEILIPVETSRFSLQGVDHLMDITRLIKDRLDHPVDSKILITMFDSRLRHSFAMLAKIKEQFGTILIKTIIHVNVKLKESAVMGKTVAKYDKYCRGSKDYFSLAKEIISVEKSTEEAMPQQAQSFTPEMNRIVEEEVKKMPTVQRFSFVAPEAKSVYVTGSFNNWSLDESCRMKANDGRWEIDVNLDPGVYQYQFIIDGKWQEDPENPLRERNSFGDINSLIEVTESAKEG